MMIATIVLTVTLCVTGTLSQYAQRPTDSVLLNRSVLGRTAHTLPADRTSIDGYIAVYDCADIGRVYDVTWSGKYARLMVFDCAGSAETRAWMRSGNVVGEIDWYTARRWGVLGRGLRGARMCRVERQTLKNMITP